jgi:hypothetical protein
MRSSYKVYQKVAENCSEFDSVNMDGTYTNAFTNSSSESSLHDVSCVNCSHFDEGEYCVLDLYDPITKKHRITE